MAINRRLPQSDEARQRALTAAKNRKDNVAPADMAITPATQTRLDAIQPLFKTKMQERSNKLSVQTGSTATVIEAKRKAIMFISHFFQVFNFGVKRGRYPASDRAFYNLPVSSENLPNINTEDEIILWGGRIEDGDAARVTAGGDDMENPKASEVKTEVDAFVTANNDQSNTKTAYDQAQEAVETQRTEADAVIKKVWDEVETFYNEETKESQRRKAREWGVIYISDLDEIINLLIKDQADSSAIQGALILLLETGEEFTTGIDGKKTIRTGIEGSITLRISHAAYITKDITITFQHGVHEYNETVMMVRI